MARAKFQTLTEQMFYILLCLRTECCGIDVMAQVEQMTDEEELLDAAAYEAFCATEEA